MTLEKKLTKQGNSELYKQNSLNGGEGGQEGLKRKQQGKCDAKLKMRLWGEVKKCKEFQVRKCQNKT